ncbi:MAG: winged helix-turn-helix domain-containing protein [Limisphaerales bacterium]
MKISVFWEFGSFLFGSLPMHGIISGTCEKGLSLWPEFLWGFLKVILTSAESAVYEFDNFRLDAAKRLLWNSGEALPLTPKAFDALLYLLRNAGKTVDKDELMAAIWPDTVVEENNLNKNISILRQVLGEKPGEHRFIATVPGRGYRFVASVVKNSVNDVRESVPTHGTPPPLSTPRPGETGEAIPVSFSYRRYWLPAATAIILLAVTLFLWRASNAPKAGPIHSIAVLPFTPIATESRNEAMEFGMADSLITQLSKSNDLVVRPFSETRRYGGTDRNPVEIGRSLGVDAVLDGSIQAAEERIRITARLIRTLDGQQLWTSNFDEQMRDVFDVQDSITERVAVVLNAKLGRQSRKRYTENVESYQQFVLGRYTALKLTPQDHYKAIEYFRNAIAKDPNYALAYAGITATYIAYTLGSDARPADTMPEAKAAAMKAVELDDDLPDAHAAMGKVAMFYDWNWAEAERHFLRAYDLDPNDTEALLFLAHLYSNIGKHEKALELGRRAKKLDPLTINRNALEGQFLFYSGRYDDAIASLQQTIELNPNHWLPRMFIARVYVEKGMFREALAECEHAKQLGSSSLELDALEGWSYAKLGDKKNARGALEYLEGLSQRRYVPPYFPALIHNALGETDVALSELEKGLAARDMRMIFLKVDPKWNNMRNEPRFIAIMKKMNFE